MTLGGFFVYDNNMSTTLGKPQIIVENGRPKAVVLDIEKYRKLLELVENKEDLLELKKIKKSTTNFKELKEYIKERV